jgi:SAM-dependent methyltransferase
MDLKETYNQIAEDWHQDHRQDDWWFKGTDKFISFLQKGDLILDVGCGTGTKSKYLIGRGLKVVGIDFSEKMINIAKREVPLGTFFVLDLNEINKLKYLFDGIFMQAVLLHIPKQKVAKKLKKAVAKLKKGGYLYIAVKEKKPQRAEEEIRIENDYGYTYERFFSYFTLDEIEAHLQNMEFKIVFSEVRTSGNTNWIQVIGQK